MWARARFSSASAVSSPVAWSGVAFFEAEPAQAAKDSLGEVRSGSRDGAAVPCAVGVGHAQRIGQLAGEVQAACVDCTMVAATQGDEVFDGVGAALGAGADVVDVEVVGVAAAGDLAAVLVALEDAAAQCRRDGCRGS